MRSTSNREIGSSSLPWGIFYDFKLFCLKFFNVLLYKMIEFFALYKAAMKKKREKERMRDEPDNVIGSIFFWNTLGVIYFIVTLGALYRAWKCTKGKKNDDSRLLHMVFALFFPVFYLIFSFFFSKCKSKN